MVSRLFVKKSIDCCSVQFCGVCSHLCLPCCFVISQSCLATSSTPADQGGNSILATLREYQYPIAGVAVVVFFLTCWGACKCWKKRRAGKHGPRASSNEPRVKFQPLDDTEQDESRDLDLDVELASLRNETEYDPEDERRRML